MALRNVTHNLLMFLDIFELCKENKKYISGQTVLKIWSQILLITRGWDSAMKPNARKRSWVNCSMHKRVVLHVYSSMYKPSLATGQTGKSLSTPTHPKGPDLTGNCFIAESHPLVINTWNEDYEKS